MQESLENLTKPQLLALLQKKENSIRKKEDSIQKATDRLAKTEKDLAIKEKKYIQKIADLEFQLAQYKRLVFGQKRERFETADHNQLSLPFELDPEIGRASCSERV